MVRSLVNADGDVVNLIVIDDASDYPLPAGWSLADPFAEPYVAASPTPANPLSTSVD